MVATRKYHFFSSVVNTIAERSAEFSGRFLYKPHVAWWNNRSWLTPYLPYLDGTRLLDRRFTLVQWAESTRQLSGSTCECGVYTGIGSAIICKALDGTYHDWDFHFAFDSFEGLPKPDEKDKSLSDIHYSYAAKKLVSRNWRKGDLRSPMEIAQELLHEFTFCKLVRGWIPACFNSIETELFRFVHIDTDIYRPTLESLDFFYPRMVRGGVLICDDYGMLTCPGARSAVDEFRTRIAEPIVELSTGQAVLIKA